MNRYLHSRLNDLEIRAEARLNKKPTKAYQLVRILSAREMLKLVENLRDGVPMPEMEEIIDLDIQAGEWPDHKNMSEDGRQLFFENMILACQGRIEDGEEDAEEEFLRYLDNPN